MTLNVSYMGTKSDLSPRLATLISTASPGPLLDLFSGVCSIASAVGSSREIWCNDVQTFAHTVGKAFLHSPCPPIHYHYAAELLRRTFLENYNALAERFSQRLRAEAEAIHSLNLQRIVALETNIEHVGSNSTLETERASLAQTRNTFPYRLFSITFAGGYFGLEQSVQFDSIRYAMDFHYEIGDLDEHQHRWLCLALCQAASKVATSTGHFAQFMHPKEGTIKRYSAQRRRSVWREWLKAIYEFTPIGTSSWRSNNRVFKEDANELLDCLMKSNTIPSVVYADPPYTADQYSRYYHLLDTIILYDYPTAIGVGRYRPDRYCSRYSRKSTVGEALSELVESCGKMSCTLILSYPENGLMPESKKSITALIKAHFGDNFSVFGLDHFHSSLGGSKGREKYAVKELVFVAGQK